MLVQTKMDGNTTIEIFNDYCINKGEHDKTCSEIIKSIEMIGYRALYAQESKKKCESGR